MNPLIQWKLDYGMPLSEETITALSQPCHNQSIQVMILN